MPDISFLKRLHNNSVNFWPAKNYYFLNGWLLRFNEGVTGRANSVHTSNYFGSDLDQDLSIVEDAYRSVGLPSKFMVYDFSEPDRLGDRLVERGYIKAVDRITDVMGIPLTNLELEAGSPQKSYVIKKYKIQPNAWERIIANTPKNRKVISHIFNRVKIPKRFLVAEDGRKEVGTLFVATDPSKTLYIAELYVSKDHRRKGVARRLMIEGLRWGQKQGAEIAWLQVLKTNKKAKRLYESMGFQEWYSYAYFSKE